MISRTVAGVPSMTPTHVSAGELRTESTTSTRTPIPNTLNSARPVDPFSMKGYRSTPASWTAKRIADGSLRRVRHTPGTLTGPPVVAKVSGRACGSRDQGRTLRAGRVRHARVRQGRDGRALPDARAARGRGRRPARRLRLRLQRVRGRGDPAARLRDALQPLL